MIINSYSLLATSTNPLQKIGYERSFTEKATDSANEFKANVTNTNDLSRDFFESEKKNIKKESSGRPHSKK